jgi:hypothetical protein
MLCNPTYEIRFKINNHHFWHVTLFSGQSLGSECFHSSTTSSRAELSGLPKLRFCLAVSPDVASSRLLRLEAV